jgi:hypothetical protein
MSAAGVVATNPYSNYLQQVPLKDATFVKALSATSTRSVPSQLLRAWNGGLFTIANNSCYFVNPWTGASQILSLGHGVASGAVAIALTDDNYMYMIRGNSLYYMSSDNSFAPILFGTAGVWTGVTAMTAVGKQVYIANNLGLYVVNYGMSFIHLQRTRRWFTIHNCIFSFFV